MQAASSNAVSGWARFLAALTGQRVALALGAAALVALALNPIFVTPFLELLGRTLFIAIVLLLVFTAAGLWPRHGAPSRWVVQLLAVGLAAPLATLAVYLISVGGNLAELTAQEGRLWGFLWIAGSGLVIGTMLSLGALYRERDAEARSAALAFELEKRTLEKQALDARLALLNSQIEPHFLFNTLANVQALVESGSPNAAPVLGCLIAYLKAAIPKRAGAPSTLGDEAALARAYLELMRMRMPDRLEFSVDIAAELAPLAFPPMALLTLVENAVRHGVDPSEQGGRIDVAARRAGGRLRIEVADSGVGLAPHASSGTGLANLRERLLAFFGSDARLELSEQAPHGVRAAIDVAPR